MGCDIHSYAEKKTEYGWKKLGDIFPLPEWLLEIRPEYEKNHAHPFYDRNYILFSLLAGVRNRNNVTPLAEPRGLPEDVSDAVRVEHKNWECDAHSTSWLSLSELVNADLTQVISAYGREDKLLTYLGDEFMRALIILTSELLSPDVTDIRVVFWFDS